ncbi:uncharacterized protein DS421_14g452920 [Arachis hypogaea]|nr:uncharacterized protein DS421_14g452920 [Arachis hypogaea]
MALSVSSKEGSMRSYCHIMLFLVLLDSLCYSSLAMVTAWPVIYKSSMIWNEEIARAIQIAILAVKEHNRRSKANLKLEQLLSWIAIDVSPIDTIYILQLLARDGLHTHKYTAQLMQIASSSAYKLHRFERAP